MAVHASFTTSDATWMRLALAQAGQAAALGEVPVGAVLVQQDRLIAASYNQPIRLHDPSAHAEILTLRAAGMALANYRLPGATLYVTLEPCIMCAGALCAARVARVVYAATDAKAGAAGSVLDAFAYPSVNHHTRVEGGLLAEEAVQLLQQFFAQRRAAKRGLASPAGAMACPHHDTHASTTH